MEAVIVEKKINLVEEGTNNQKAGENLAANIKYVFFGMFFGVVLVKAEVVSWFRIQEMFRLQSFHMYGVLCTAVVVATISTLLIKYFKIKTLAGEEVVFKTQPFNKGNIFGGLLFGFGWALTGACPGPMYALVGAGFLPLGVSLASALFGTYIYGLLRDKLPH